jgi:hypothetical protein
MAKEGQAVRVIFRCRLRSCRHVWAIDYRAGPWGNLWREGSDFSQDWAKPCAKCSTTYARTGHVKGRYSAKHKCDPRCTGATGHNCECQCGGANHGADHLAA